MTVTLKTHYGIKPDLFIRLSVLQDLSCFHAFVQAHTPNAHSGFPLANSSESFTLSPSQMSPPPCMSLTSPERINCSAVCVPTSISERITFHYSCFLVRCPLGSRQFKEDPSTHAGTLGVYPIVGPQQTFI